jgi:hypothetical protein
MSAQERLAAFRQALAEASARFGVRLAVVQQLGAVILDEPALGFVVLDEDGVPSGGTAGSLTDDSGAVLPHTSSPLAASDTVGESCESDRNEPLVFLSPLSRRARGRG